VATGAPYRYTGVEPGMRCAQDERVVLETIILGQIVDNQRWYVVLEEGRRSVTVVLGIKLQVTEMVRAFHPEPKGFTHIIVLRMGRVAERQFDSIVANALILGENGRSPTQAILFKLSLPGIDRQGLCGFGQDVAVATVEERYETSTGVEAKGA